MNTTFALDAASPRTSAAHVDSKMLICKSADNTIRWKEGERLHHLFEQRCDELHAGNGPTDAVITRGTGRYHRDKRNGQ